MFLQNLINKNRSDRFMRYADFLDGHSPVFSQFGKDIYASDVVQMCIDVIATECSKLAPKHIRTDDNGLKIHVKGSLNRLFKFALNELMTTRDFIEKITWQLYMNYNAFIYPMRNESGFKGFYPLNPERVDFLQDDSGRLFVDMYFANKESFRLPYSDIVHLRKKYSMNDIMGGGINGQPDNEALLKVLEINNTVLYRR